VGKGEIAQQHCRWNFVLCVIDNLPTINQFLYTVYLVPKQI